MHARTYLLAAAAITAAAILPGSAAAGWTLRFSFVPEQVYQGLPAAVSVLVKPANARCSLRVRYADGSMQGSLHPVRASSGRAAWKWTMALFAPPGAAHAFVSCGQSGSLSHAFTVVGGTVRPSKLRVDADGFSQRPDRYDAGSTVSYGVVLDNPSSTQDAQNVTVLVNFLDAGSRVLQTATSRVTTVAAAATFNVGGYASLPVLAAARMAGVPAMIQEQNSVPGIANRLGARIARATAAGFEAACRRLPGRCVWTGNPVREEFFRVPSAAAGGRRVLLFGGSQGARVLNRAIAGAAPALAAAGIEVLAQTGERELGLVRDAVAPFPSITAVPFVDAMAEAFSRADLVVARAGALTLAEIAAAARPSILVPFAAATHAHQEENARVFESAGAAVVIGEGDLDGATLARTVDELLGDPGRLRRMGEAARTLGKPDAAERIVDLLFEIAE